MLSRAKQNSFLPDNSFVYAMWKYEKNDNPIFSRSWANHPQGKCGGTKVGRLLNVLSSVKFSLDAFATIYKDCKCKEVTASGKAGAEVGNSMGEEVDKSAQSSSPREVNKTIEMRVLYWQYP